MRSVVVRTRELFESEPDVGFTVNVVSNNLHCSYSTARRALKFLFQKGELWRERGKGGRGHAKTNEWVYRKRNKR